MNAEEFLINEYVNFCTVSFSKKELTNLLEAYAKQKVLEALKGNSMKDAYKAGQNTMSCGCYEITDAQTFEEWITK